MQDLDEARLRTKPSRAKPASRKRECLVAKLHKKMPIPKKTLATIPQVFGPVLSNNKPKGRLLR
jgi:hypothetical protein